MADKLVPVAEKRLMEVKLGELGSWILARDFSPMGFWGAIRRGHARWYTKYIDVKKGGLGGITMVLVGYVVLSYAFHYEHLKHERWRKYH